jgi:signal transduction histidine kinase
LKYDDIIVEQRYGKDLYDVFVDENQIEQVFLNFFLNAFDAIGKSGKIQVVAENASESNPILDRRNRMTSPLSNRYIQISIKDSGVGMPEGLREKIYDPFFTTKSNGTGLGLSIVYQIIREHGGQIEVRSEENKGTEFIVLLPAYVKGRKLPKL